MKPGQFLLFAIICIIVTLKVNAQTGKIPFDKDSSEITQTGKEKEQHLNFLKLHLTAIALKNYSIQYERVISKRVAFGLSLRVMPETTVPFKNLILNSLGDEDPDTKESIESFRLSNFAFTPEVRFYAGKKGYGRGFYIAPFYRFAKFESSHLAFTYENNLNVKSNINLSGKLTANTGGIMFGAQWLLGRICLDWWILGPHYGSGSGNFTGVSNQPLTQDEQNDLRQTLEDLDIPLTHKTVTVNANGASLQLDGPWGGIRAGLLVGVRF